MAGGGNGVLYGVRTDGALVWYRHTGWQTVGTSWASGSGRVIGAGFNQFISVFGRLDGSLRVIAFSGYCWSRRQ
ncbi:tachylectin-related carbohydrate-binding protein [Micromonospora sp. NBC_00898]|uniref:tachylectin-related carbohydrate-binding protein n=1 Tax=Micromonospora sp. NBC_00898 TaxID=2975981 RepID=UPI0038633015